MELKALIKKRIARLESVPDSLLGVIEKQQIKAYEDLLVDLNTLEQKGGKFLPTNSNAVKINAIAEKLKQVFMGRDYVEAIKEFAVQINNQATLNNSILLNTIGEFSDDDIFKTTIKNAQRNALLLLDENAVARQFIQPISDMLTTATTTGAGYLDSVKLLKKSMVGENAIYRKNAGTFVKDAFAIADRQYVQLTATAYGIEFYRYDGGEVAGSRQFCIERHEQIFHIKEIEAWGAFKNTDPSKFEYPKFVRTNARGIKIYWEGMNENTNSGTIKSFIGGYGCIHALVPIATKYVPEAVTQRASSLGFYKKEA